MPLYNIVSYMHYTLPQTLLLAEVSPRYLQIHAHANRAGPRDSVRPGRSTTTIWLQAPKPAAYSVLVPYIR